MQEEHTMKRLIVTALNVGMAAGLAVGLSACNGANADAAVGEAGSKFARVVSVDPVREQTEPKQVCHDEVVTRHVPVKDQHQIAGTAIGAVAGGLLGNQVGGGKGRTLATVAGAIGGGYAGKRVQENRQETNTTQSVQRRCDMVGEKSDRVVAYDVKYQYNGVTRSARMDHDPGDRVQVQEGVVSVSDAR
jgi:uncharacterized protein YcfJ